MRLNVSRVEFSDYDFIRLFLAYVRINGNIFIDKDGLRYDLYDLYKISKYKELFQDIAVKHQIENNYLEIDEALLNAVLCGLLSSQDFKYDKSIKIILIDANESMSIIDGYNEKYKNKMQNLVDEFLNKKIKKNKSTISNNKTKVLTLLRQNK